MGNLNRLMSSEDLHPIDIVESIATDHDWDFDRIGDDQIAMAIEGQWRTYSLSLAWSAYDETLRIICTFDMDPPEDQLARLYHAMALANDQNWQGAFTLWQSQKLMVFRYALNLAGGATASPAQIDDMVGTAVLACERFYPAFQLVCWGGEPPERAMDIAIDEAYGTA
tara:strand:- start:1311 stop:1814 length:504 start_codon:yes stop_codon:yes gene_type:complete